MKPTIKTTFCILFFFLQLSFLEAQDSTSVTIVLPNAEEWKESSLTLNYSHPVLSNEVFIPVQKETNSIHNFYRVKFHNSVINNETRQWTVKNKNNLLFQIIVIPGDNIVLEVQKDGNVKFTEGMLSKESQLTYNYWFANFDNPRVFARYDWDTFFNALDNLQDSLITVYEESLKGYKPNNIYDLYYRTSIKNAMLHVIESYKFLRPSFLGRKGVLSVPERLKERVPKLEIINDDSYPYINLYMTFIPIFFEMSYCDDKEGIPPRLICQYKYSNTLPKSRFKRLLDLSIVNKIAISDESDDDSLAVEILDQLKIDYPNNYYVGEAEKVFNRRVKLKKGKPAPNFAFQKGEEFIKLNDLKGKYVLIHFWSTRAKQEIGKTLEFNKTEEHLLDRIEFLYLCLDCDMEEWNKLKLDNDLRGTQIFLNDLQSQLFKFLYDVKYYPTSFLIDKDGKILKSQVYSLKELKDVLSNTKSE